LELALLTPESFDLANDSPTIMLEAACTKTRRAVVQSLPIGAAAALRDYLRAKPAGRVAWPGISWPVHGSILVRMDLAEARPTWLSEAPDDSDRTRRERSDFLVYIDTEGRFADFHGLRHTYITMVGKSGVAPKECQYLARHSTYTLTSNDAHSRFYDVAAAVQSYPIRPSRRTAIAPGNRDGWPDRTRQT
jgi:integrase